MRDRDTVILRKIVQYAEEIEGTIEKLALTQDTFKHDYIAKNAISMCVLQIGELAGKLTDEFRAEYCEVPWRNYISIRNRAAHAYGSMDIEILWKIAASNIPELYDFCKDLLR